MPVKVVRKDGKFRVVEAATGKVVKSSGGKAADGGGHANKSMADAQARAINASKHRK